MNINALYDLESIVDDSRLGGEPSPEYLENVNMIDNIVRECMYVSKSYGGILAPSGRHSYAAIIFTALITRGVSLAILTPYTPWAEKRIEHWDYASVTGIVRTMLELRLAFYYLCVDKCSDDEWYCRWNIFNLHDCVSRIRLFESMEKSQDQVNSFQKQAEELRERLKSNLYFAALPEKQKKQFLHGQKAYMMPLEIIGELAGIEKSKFRWLYVLFSSHVHGLPMSFYRIGSGAEERGRGLPSPTEEGYTSLCLSTAATLLVRTRDELHELFSGLVKPPDNEKSTQSEALTGKSPANTEQFEIGSSVETMRSETLRIETTRIGLDSFKISYYDLLSNECVLIRTISADGETGLEWFDAMFWTVLINGKPATEKSLSETEYKRYAFKVDHNTNTIHFIFDM